MERILKQPRKIKSFVAQNAQENIETNIENQEDMLLIAPIAEKNW